MKKIALILALVMVFAVALVACDEASENSTPANEASVSATEDSSTPAEDSSEPADTDDSSDDGEVSEPADVVEPAAVGENVAAGKTYTTSQLYKQGGADVNWAYDENAAVAYPDEDGISFTDGVVDPGDSDYTNVVWAGFSCNCPDYQEVGYSWITVDLGATTDISKVVLYIATSALETGISAEGFSAEFFVSDDGETWTSIGSASATDDASVNYTTIEAATNVSGQYVQVRMSRGGWMFVSEVEVYDVAK